jgi:hypothetical protein
MALIAGENPQHQEHMGSAKYQRIRSCAIRPLLAVRVGEIAYTRLGGL